MLGRRTQIEATNWKCVCYLSFGFEAVAARAHSMSLGEEERKGGAEFKSAKVQNEAEDGRECTVTR